MVFHQCVSVSEFPLPLRILVVLDLGESHGFNPWVRKMPWRRARQPTPIFLPGESHGQRSLVGYSPQHRNESDMTEAN